MFVPTIDEQIEGAIRVNAAWKKLLYDAIALGHHAISSCQACEAELCDMGQWLNSTQFNAQLRESDEYQEVDRLHRAFHRSAGNILSYVERGRASAAHFLLEGEFMQRSDDLVDALVRMRTAFGDTSSSVSGVNPTRAADTYDRQSV